MRQVSSREFNRDVSAAKRAAADEPVVITDRGEAAFVLMSIRQYRRLTGEDRSVLDWLQMQEDIDFEPARLTSVARPAEL